MSALLPDDRAVDVDARLVFDVADPSTIDLLVTPADSAGTRHDEHLTATLDGDALPADAVRSHPLDGTTLTVVDAPPGELVIHYSATVEPTTAAADAGLPEVLDVDHAVGLRPGRYTPSDELGGFAASLFGSSADPTETALKIRRWVTSRLTYDPGASRGTDTAADTLHAGAGVCRDFAHLTATLCRSLEIPSRVVAVYAPGLSPMDFHAVAEVMLDGRWWILDATLLAPRPSLVRIATGTDAAQTAFANVKGAAELSEIEVTAVVEGDLPADDHSGLAAIR